MAIFSHGFTFLRLVHSDTYHYVYVFGNLYMFMYTVVLIYVIYVLLTIVFIKIYTFTLFIGLNGFMYVAICYHFEGFLHLKPLSFAHMIFLFYCYLGAAVFSSYICSNICIVPVLFYSISDGDTG